MKQFHAKVITPEKLFFEGDVEMVTVEGIDGQLGIMAEHIPMAAPLKPGELRIKINDVWKSAAAASGFVAVEDKETLILVQTCEWPEDIDARLAEERIREERESMLMKQSKYEHMASRMAIARAMNRLRISRNKTIND